MALLEGYVPFPEEFKKLYREKGYWEDKTMYEVLEEAMKKYNSKEMIVFGDERITYGEALPKIHRLAAHFVDLGLKPLDRVVFQLANGLLNALTLIACYKIGVIPILALPAHRFTEINHFVQHGEAVATFTPTGKYDYVSMVEEIQAGQKTLKYLFTEGPTNNERVISLEKLLATPIEDKYPEGSLDKYRIDPEQPCQMILSGGTTGIPKLIPRDHNSYVYNIKQCGKVGGYDENTVFLAVLPMAHNYTLGCPGYLSTFVVGGKTVVATGMDEPTLFATIEKEKVTHIASAGPLIARWVVAKDIDKYDLSSLKVIQNGGARCAPELRQALIDKYKVFPQEIYGTGEGLLNLCPLDADEEMMLTSSGKPISPGDEIKVVDDNFNEVPLGKTGELIIRGPYNIRGYYKAPDHNKSAFTPDGFYRMGDIVRLNEKGFLFTEGRVKDLINRGGEKISCDEVEAYILSNPKVEQCSVVAMPDKIFGEKACAFVQPKSGQSLDLKELVEFMKGQNIASFKLPERLELIDTWPLSPAGKILKTTLREIVTKKLEDEAAAKK